MKSALSFLIAARNCEIEELDQLARTGELVGAIARLVHALQKERGLSNLFLGSGGARGAQARERQVQDCDQLAQAVRAGFAPLTQDVRRVGNGARLFSRIAWVLPGLGALTALRARIAALALPPDEAAAAFARLIAGLLAVVFEAADGATDAEVSRQLVALFNLMQGKELGGQERACGTAAFAAGRIDAPRQQRWLHLIESQERCFHLFAEFCDGPARTLWQHGQGAEAIAELERLRRIGCTSAAGAALNTEWSSSWFQCCSTRLDNLKGVEDHLCSQLQALCARKTALAQRERAQLQALAQQLDASIAGLDDLPADVFGLFERAAEGSPPGWTTGLHGDLPADLPGATAQPPALPYGHQMARSILDMLQAQSRRLQAIGDELATVRGALNERKLVERAKGLLMAHRRLDEAAAHKLLRDAAMNQNRRLVEVAESVLALAELLPPMAPPGRTED